MPKLKGLYAITDEILTPNSTILKQLEEALKAGVDIVQLRDKSKKDSEIFNLAREIKDLCSNFGATFIIDDRLELAKEIDCDGIHIGKHDIEFDKARAILKDKIVGVSCYADVQKAKKMQEAGADYVAFGSFFPSPTKPNSAVIKKETLKIAKQKLSIPICSIGGINIDNLKEISSDSDMVAVVSDIWRAKSISDRVNEYKKILEGVNYEN